jgi:heme a synthase
MTGATTSADSSQLELQRSDNVVSLWLFSVAALVFLMIVVGGATRLTDSGLSITEWKPILGAIPPLTDADWQAAFAKYQQIPEYDQVNRGMSLAAFKEIYWWEWGHRFLGRFIGIAFAVPFALLWFGGHLRPGWPLKLAGVLALGALQGGIGWYMVMSGLVDRVDVSQYRLALHLSVAFLILGLLLWLAFELKTLAQRGRTRPANALRCGAIFLTALLFVQVVLGALVAGLKAGLAYNTWPLMDGAFVPEALFALRPWYLNIFEDETTVQFNHRLVAYAVTAAAIWQTWAIIRSPAPAQLTKSALWLVSAIAAQVLLGIWTLLAAVPLSLGLAHQAGAAVVWVLAVRHLHDASRPA